MSDKEWMTIEEVVERVMRVENCSRRAARKKVAAAVKSKKLRIKRTPTELPPAAPLPAEEAARLFEESPELLYTTLAEFKERHDFTGEELLSELRSGRLVANGSELTLFKIEIGEPVSPVEFTVSYQAIVDWIANPKTPEHLIAKFNDSMTRKIQ